VAHEPHPNSREERLNEAIADYYQAVERGQTPDRQAFLARHPDLASELESFLADKDLFEKKAAPLPPAAPAPGMAGNVNQASTLAREHPAAPDIPWGTVRYFGDYELLEEIARGGMGVVFKARQVSLNRMVALKMILAGQFASAADVVRFRSEAEAAANLDHPHLVPIYEVGEHQGQQYFSMKLIDSGSLTQHLPRLANDPRGAARLLATVARAVHYAHQRGILHRDLKPGNILLDSRGQPHVTDFGLAKRVEGDSHLTQSGAIVGTPSYMAPEQASGKKASLSTAADIYSLGAIFYEMLVGRPPFQAETPLDTLLQVAEKEPTRPRNLNPRVDRDLETICLKCLEKEPARRFGSAEALAEDLERWLRGEPIQARPSSAWERTRKWVRRRPAIAALVAALILVLITSFSAVTWQWLEAETARDKALASAASEKKARQKAEVARKNALAAKAKEARARRREEKTRKAAQRAERLALQAKAKETRARRDEKTARLQAEVDRDAKKQALVRADGLRLSAEAAAARYTDPGLSLLLAIEGVRRTPAMLTYNTLYEALQSCREVRTLSDVVSMVRSATYSRDGRHIYTLGYAGWDRPAPLTIREAATGKELRKTGLLGRERLASVCFSPDNQRVLTIPVGYEFVQHKDGRTYEYTDRMAHILDIHTGKELVRLRRHDDRIISAEFSPDGKQVLTGSWDGTARLWDARTGKQRALLKKHTKALHLAAFSPDGGKILAVTSNVMKRSMYSGDKTRKPELIDPALAESVRAGGGGEGILTGRYGADAALASVWDARTHKLVAVFNKAAPGLLTFGHVWYPTTAGFNKDGSQVVIGFTDDVAAVWDARKSGLERVVLRGHKRAVHAAAFSPDGRSIVTGGQDGTVRLWDSATGKQRLLLKGHEGPVQIARFSRDGKRVLTAANDGTARVWDTVTGQEMVVLRGHSSSIPSAEFSRDGRYVLTCDNTTARIWDTAPARMPGRVIPGYQHPIAQPGFSTWSPSRSPRSLSLAFSPNSQRLLVASTDGTAQLVDVATGKQALKLGKDSLLGEIRSAFFSSTGRRVVTASAHTYATAGNKVINTSAVHVWDARTGAELLALDKHQQGALFAQLSPDGRRLVTVADGSVRSRRAGDLGFSHFQSDSRQAGVVRLWDARDGKLLATVPNKVQAGFLLRFSPDSRLLLLAPGHDSTAFLLDSSTGQPKITLKGPQGRIMAAVFSQDGRRLALAYDDRTARLWDPVRGRLLALFDGFEGEVVDVAFSKNGRRLATVSGKSVHVWDAVTRARLATLQGHEQPVTRAAFSPDGRAVLTASQDRTAALWEISTGRMMALYRGHTDTVVEAVFSPDGRHVATASADGTARLWPVDLWPFVLQRKPRELTPEERRRYEVPEAVAPGKESPREPAPAVRAIPAPGEAGQLAAAVRPNHRAAASQLKKLTAQMTRPRADTERLRQDLLTLQRSYPGTAQARQAARLVKTLPSPLDRLDPAKIPSRERAPWQPKELVAVLGTHGHRHWGAVAKVSFAQQGKMVASSGEDGCIRLWDARTLAERGVIPGKLLGFVTKARHLVSFLKPSLHIWDLSGAKPREIRTVNLSGYELALCPDGRRVALRSGHAVQLLDISSAKPTKVAALQGHTNYLTCLAFSPNGRMLASGSYDNTVRLWHLEGAQPKEIAVFKGHSHAVNTLLFSPDGKTLASSWDDRTLQVWDVTATPPRERFLFKDLATWKPALAFRADGERLAVAEGTIGLWDITGAKAIKRASIPYAWASSVAFAPDGKTLVCGSGDWTVHLWDLTGALPRELAGLTGHRKMVKSVAFTPDGRSLISGSDDNSVRIWSLGGARPKELAALEGVGGQPALAPDGKTLVTALPQRRVWNLRGKAPREAARFGASPSESFKFAPDGKTLVSWSWKGLHLWDVRGHLPRERARYQDKKGKYCRAVDFSPDGQLLAVAWDLGYDEELRFLRRKQTSLKEVLLPRIQGHVVAVSPDGRTLATSNRGWEVHLWDLTGPLPVERAAFLLKDNPTMWESSIASIKFAPDGATLAASAHDGRVVVWETSSGTKRHDWQFKGVVQDVAFSSDGRHLATGNANGSVYVLRLAPPNPKGKATTTPAK
jgi:WD40 repeat protein